MIREEKQKAIDALKISAPVMAVTQEEFNDYIQTINQVMDWLEQEPCEDAISRQAVFDCLTATKLKKFDFILHAREEIKKLPSVTPQEPKTGHWIGIDEEPHEDYECSCCGYVVSTFTANIEPHTEYKYCPHCGAKMESEE